MLISARRALARAGFLSRPAPPAPRAVSETYRRVPDPPFARSATGRVALRPLAPRPAEVAAARAAATPGQLASEMADILAAAHDARGAGTEDDLRRAGFTAAQIAVAARPAAALAQRRLDERGAALEAVA